MLGWYALICSEQLLFMWENRTWIPCCIKTCLKYCTDRKPYACMRVHTFIGSNTTILQITKSNSQLNTPIHGRLTKRILYDDHMRYLLKFCLIYLNHSLQLLCDQENFVSKNIVNAYWSSKIIDTALFAKQGNNFDLITFHSNWLIVCT